MKLNRRLLLTLAVAYFSLFTFHSSLLHAQEKTVTGKEVVDISGQNTSSSYKTHSTAYRMIAGSELELTTARYTYITSQIRGEGKVTIKSGGERTYLGGSDKMAPDWSQFKGDVHVYPYKDLSGSNGFYGLVWMHNGKTFNVDAAMTNLDDSKANTTLFNSTITLHDGTALAAESGTHGIRIGHLEMEEGSQLYGYVKSKDNNNTYYIVGADNQDAALAGRISPMSDNLNMLLGILKEGNGTYRITGNKNLISGGIRIMNGRVLINNDAETAKKSKLSGATGTPKDASTTGVYVLSDGIIGGTGNISATTNLYGIMQPGDDGIGTLTIADYAKSQKLSLILRPEARIDCEIKDAANYDKVIVNGSATYYNIGEDFAVSENKPRLRILLSDEADLKEGDEFTLFTATSKDSYNDVPWNFRIIYPKRYTWDVEERTDADGLKVVARVKSVIYSGQGDIDDDNDGDNDDYDAGSYDLTSEKRSNVPLRTYINKRNAYIGTCVPVWTINVDDDNDTRSALIAKEFNMAVCENEMKFDATEPNRGEFDYYHGDRLINFANRHNMRVRGHCLAWHSQVPGWLTDDGKKNSYNYSKQELLSILKNHIMNVVGHWKGKVHEWDVANEVLDDNQSSIYSNPNGYDLRPSVWATGIGEEFLDSAFTWAHQADPNAILILNDYGVEGKGWGKSEALYNLAMRLKKSGIPIHGVGLQGHMDAGLDFARKIDANIARYEQAGLLCHITELDLGIDNSSSENLQKQADTYYSLARIAMKYDNCKQLMIWGLTDDLTWRTGRQPLLFNSSNTKKPAYYGVHAALRQFAEDATAIEQVPASPSVKNANPTVTFNLQGQRVSAMQKGTIYVVDGKKYICK